MRRRTRSGVGSDTAPETTSSSERTWQTHTPVGDLRQGPDEQGNPDETPAGQLRRTREIEIDVLVAHELAIGSPAGELLWRSVNWDPPTEPPTVLYQQTRGNTSRTTDIEARASVGRLLIEDKAPGGEFEEDQPESYAAELIRDPAARAVLVAPRAFIDRHPSEMELFSSYVSLEDLAEALADAAEGDASELGRGYAWRAGEFTRCAFPSIGDRRSNPDAWVIEFGDQYRELARSRGRQVPGALRGKFSRILLFPDWTLNGRHMDLFHQLKRGCVDLHIIDWQRDALEALIESLDEQDRPPVGWRVDQASGPWPILRYELTPIPEDLPPFGEVEDVVAEALDAIANLKTWFDTTGRRVLEEPSAHSLRRLLHLSTDMARHQQLDRLADEISALEHRVPD
jgi:hypothetical protein